MIELQKLASSDEKLVLTPYCTDSIPLVDPKKLFPSRLYPETRRFKRGEVMFHQGDPVGAFYIVQEGIAKELLVNENGESYITDLATRRNPIILGLEGLDAEPYGTSAEAVTPVIAQRVPSNELIGLVRTNPEYAFALLRHFSHAIRKKTQRLGDMIFLDLQARLAIGMLEAADKLDDYSENTDDLPEISQITQEDLAAMIGGTRASVNRMLGYWEDKGYLKRVGRRIEIRNSHAIKSIGANEAVLEPFPPIEEVSGQRKTA